MISTSYCGERRFEVNKTVKIPPGPGEVQIEVAYCGVCGTDLHIFHGMMDKRVPYPMTIGHEMSGIVVAIGENVNGVTMGDKVVVRPLDTRNERDSDKGLSHICAGLKILGVDSPGAMQQYWNVPAFTIHRLPEDMDMQLAAMVEPLAVACHDVRLSRLSNGELAVVLGGGPIGLLVAMVARSKGAHVIVSEPNKVRGELIRSLGFDVIDPIEKDLLSHVKSKTEGRLADVVFEVAGVPSTVKDMTKIAGLRSRIVVVAIHGVDREVSLFDVFWKELEIQGARVYEKEDYDEAIALIDKGGLPLNRIITAVEPLSKIQEVFSAMDENPDGMKVLLNCQK